MMTKPTPDTPRRLALAAGLVTVLVAGFVAILAAGTSAARGALTSMSARTGEVSATNDLYFRLNDMDAQTANALLVGFRPKLAVPASSSASASLATYEQDRAAASGDLQQVARNASLAGQYTKLLTAIGSYEGLIAQAIYIDQSSGAQDPAVPPVAALALYQQASGQMHSSVLPIARGITGQDSAAVDGLYSADRGGAQLDAVFVAVIGLLLGGTLIVVHRYVGRRFRRMLTPGLALAAVATLAVTGLGFSVLMHEAGQLKLAKAEAFDSINALTNARAVSYDANADESRWLLDRTTALQSSYFAKVGQVRGFLDTELNNITFPNEAQGAHTTVNNFDAYVQDDATIRTDAARGDLAGAVTVDVGIESGDSNAAFYQYDKALLGIIAINQNAFGAAIDEGRASLEVWTWLPYGAGIVVLALAGVALYPRMREYR